MQNMIAACLCARPRVSAPQSIVDHRTSRDQAFDRMNKLKAQGGMSLAAKDARDPSVDTIST
jgi:hypothetical protein